MAGPNDPTPPLPPPEDVTASGDAANNAAISFTGMGASVEFARTELSAMDKIAQGVSSVFQGFTNVLKDFTGVQATSVGMTDEQVTKLGLLTTAVFGSRKAFDSLQDIGTGGLSTFGDKISYITDDILKSGGGISGLADLAKNVLGTAMPKEFQTSVGAAKGFINSLVEGADNALRLQNAMVQLAGKTGGLNNLYDKTGSNLQSVNAMLAAHEDMLANTMKATGLNQKQIENYWAALGSIPGALEKTIHTGSNANTTMGMLTATIKASAAVGRDTTDVVKDMHQAFKDYGIVGGDALKFTLRFSEIASAFGVDFDDVSKALKGSAAELGHFADAGASASKMGEGLAQTMKNMVGGLMDAGMTARDAVSAVSQLENNIGKLNIAQKAFISAQSGGPGGLMGGFKIDKMLREGDFEGVFKKQMDTIKKLMGGKIVTLDEASTSQVAASQMQKQIALLQQGPLGSMIKNPQDAYKMFDMFRGTRAGSLTGERALATDPVADAVKMGTKWEEKSYGQLDLIRGNIEALRRQAGVSNLAFLQQTTTAAGMAVDPRGQKMQVASEDAEKLQAEMQSGAQQGGFNALQHQRQMKATGPYQDRSGAYASEAVQDMIRGAANIGDWFRKLPEALKTSLEGMRQAFAKNDIQAANAELRKVEDEAKAIRAQARKMTGPERDKLLKEAQDKQDAATALYAAQSQRVKNVAGAPQLVGIRPGDFGEDIRRQGANRLSPGANVGNAARPTVRPGATAPTGGGTGNVPADVQVAQQGGSNRIKVNVVVNVKDDGGQPNSTHTPGTP